MGFSMRMGMGLGAGMQKGGINHYAQSWWDALPAELQSNTDYLLAYNNFANTATNAVLGKLDCLYICVNHEETGAIHSTDSACLLNFINPAKHKLTLIGSPYTTQFTGIHANGGNNGLNMNYSPGDGETHNNKQDNHSLGVWVNSAGSGNTADMGATQTSPTNGYIIYRNTLGNIGFRSSSDYTVSSVHYMAGLITVRRNASAEASVSINTTFDSAISITSVTPLDKNIYLLGNNKDDIGLDIVSDRTISFAFAGAYLTDTEITKLYNAMSELKTALPFI